MGKQKGEHVDGKVPVLITTDNTKRGVKCYLHKELQ